MVTPNDAHISELEVKTQTKDVKVIATQRDSPMSEALLVERSKFLSPNIFRLFCCLSIAYLCSAQNGFDATTFGGVSDMPNFKAQFNTNVASTIGFLSATYVIGTVIGSFIAGPCADRWGRKWGMVIGSIITLTGTVVQATAQFERDLIAGRVVLGVGTAMLGPAAQSYAVEMSHPAYRGMMVGAYQGCYFLGSTVSTFVEYGLAFITTDSSINWRIPMAIQGVPSILVLLFVWFIPESPRWYIAQGQTKKAKAILTKYHGNGNPESKVVAIELDEMNETISTSGSDKTWWDFRDLFRTRGSRHRIFIVLCIGFFGQLDLAPTSYYFPLMAQTAGITSEKAQLFCNAVQNPVILISTLFGLSFIDRYGRRKLMMLSSLGMTISVAVIIACTALQDGHSAVGLTGLAFIYIFLASFAMVWTPCQALYPTEVLVTNTRAKGLALSGLWLNIMSFVNTYAAPVGLSNASWRFYFLYLAVDATGILVIYMTFVETRGRSLEEMDRIFEDPHPVQRSLQKQEVKIQEVEGGQINVLCKE